MKDRDNHDNIARQISDIDHKIKALRIRYEQYFAGVEKRAPIREREDLERELRQLNKRKIMQTELRYKFQNLSSSFHAYQGMWERIQREMDEGRYSRHVKKAAAKSAQEVEATRSMTEVERIYQDYQRVCQHNHTTYPSRDHLEKIINQQKEQIRAKYGNVQCMFKVTTKNGKPKIKVSLKR
ncbi:MAG: MXAN_5187 C-terminal domain-containing protein [Thermodesulfobacteriota bacterium]|nr:MXAN_5187 C-terminal domain-containing protein [Thermodesulfobacteriota bacterium]